MPALANLTNVNQGWAIHLITPVLANLTYVNQDRSEVIQTAVIKVSTICGVFTLFIFSFNLLRLIRKHNVTHARNPVMESSFWSERKFFLLTKDVVRITV